MPRSSQFLAVRDTNDFNVLVTDDATLVNLPDPHDGMELLCAPS